MEQRSPAAHSFTHNCKVMRQNHKHIWSQIFALAALHCNQNTQTHTSTLLPLLKSHNPQVNEAHSISRNTVWFHPNDKVENKTPTSREMTSRSLSLTLSLSLFTLSEAGVERARPVCIQAVGDWLQAQIHHLVKAELAAVNGGGLGFQGDEQLLRTVGRHQTSLEEKQGPGKIMFILH